MREGIGCIVTAIVIAVAAWIIWTVYAYVKGMAMLLLIGATVLAALIVAARLRSSGQARARRGEVARRIVGALPARSEAASGGYLFVRDAPHGDARLDLAHYRMPHGFRGFRVVPEGLHYLSVRGPEGECGCWCFVPASGMTAKLFNHETGQFEDEDPTRAREFYDLARNGGLQNALLPYNRSDFPTWKKLTHRVADLHFPLEELENEPIESAGDGASGKGKKKKKADTETFEGLYARVFSNNEERLLATLQFAFARSMVDADPKAYMQWERLVRLLCTAGVETMRTRASLFAQLAEVLNEQFGALGESPVPDLVREFANELRQTEEPRLARLAQSFDAYTQSAE
jgi:hypothetical protein